MIFLFAPDLGYKIYLEYEKHRAGIAYRVTAGTILLLLLLSVVIALVHYPIMFSGAIPKTCLPLQERSCTYGLALLNNR